MPKPEVTAVAERVHSQTGVWGRRDALTEDWPLLRFIEAGVFTLQSILDIISDSDDGPGWSVVMDADRAPVEFLPWLAQFAGVRVLGGESEATMRARIKARPSTARGRPATILADLKSVLAPGSAPVLEERLDGEAYRLGIALTVADMVGTNIDSVNDLLETVVPAGIIYTVFVIEPIDEGWGWTEDIAAVHIMCPVPHVDLLPDEDLLPC